MMYVAVSVACVVFLLGSPGMDFNSTQWGDCFLEFSISFPIHSIRDMTALDGLWCYTQCQKKIMKRFVADEREVTKCPSWCIYLHFSLFSSFLLYNSASCRKLVIMKMTFIYRNANYSCLVECRWSLLSVWRDPFPVLCTFISHALLPIYVWFFEFWPDGNILLVPSLTNELKKKIFDIRFSIRRRVMILSSQTILESSGAHSHQDEPLSLPPPSPPATPRPAWWRRWIPEMGRRMSFSIESVLPDSCVNTTCTPSKLNCGVFWILWASQGILPASGIFDSKRDMMSSK